MITNFDVCIENMSDMISNMCADTSIAEAQLGQQVTELSGTQRLSGIRELPLSGSSASTLVIAKLLMQRLQKSA